MCSERLRDAMGGKDLFLHHGYAVMLIEDDGTPEGGDMLAVLPNREGIIGVVKTALEEETKCRYHRLNTRENGKPIRKMGK